VNKNEEKEEEEKKKKTKKKKKKTVMCYTTLKVILTIPTYSNRIPAYDSNQDPHKINYKI
jgi:hypothetical protein